MTIDNKKLANVEKTMSERFLEKVTAEFTSGVGVIALTDFQKRLAQNYFISIDATLKTAEEKNSKKNTPDTPITWANVNMESLARSVVSAARIGFDPAQKNHINMIPFKNNTTKKYDIGFIEGYRGMELKAMKYGLDIPDSVIIELVYSTDNFIPIKKDFRNKVESYEFTITDAFNRGDIRGGFYYHIYTNNPEKNKLIMFSMKEIEKRKPKYASAEFWGGDKDKWENGKKVGKEKVEGWLDSMCYKTIARAAYNNITIDSQKIDNDYMQLNQNERSFKNAEVAAEIESQANIEAIDIEHEQVVINEEPVTVDAAPITGPSF